MKNLLVPALQARLVLALNHVLQAEPAAVSRLGQHAGRTISLEWTAEPGPWPRPPSLHLRITAAGLLETSNPAPPQDGEACADLSVRIDLPAPHRLAAQWLEGRRPAVAVEGDAELAADVAWLGDNLRWDVEHDIARLVGAAPAHQLVCAAHGFGTALRDLMQRLAGAWGGAVPPAASR